MDYDSTFLLIVKNLDIIYVKFYKRNSYARLLIKQTNEKGAGKMDPILLLAKAKREMPASSASSECSSP